MLKSAGKQIAAAFQVQQPVYEKLEVFSVESEEIQPANCCSRHIIQRRRILQFFSKWRIPILCLAIISIAVILAVVVLFSIRATSGDGDPPVASTGHNTTSYPFNNTDPSQKTDPSVNTDPSLNTDTSVNTDPSLNTDPSVNTDPSLNTDPLENHLLTEDKEQVEAKTCNSRGCKYAAKFIRQNLDAKIDPCDDFFKFSCGNWIEQRPELNSDDVAQELEAQLLINLRRRIEGPERPEDTEAIRDLMVVYNVCMNTSVDDDKEHLEKLLREFGGWPLVNETWSEQDFQLEIVLAKLAKESRFYFFQLQKHHYVSWNSFLVHDYKILPVSRSLLDRSRFSEPSIINAFKVIAAGANIDNAEMTEIVQFANNLTNILETADLYRTTFKARTLSELAIMTNQQFDWLTFVNEVFNDVGIYLTTDDFIYVDDNHIEVINVIIKLTKSVRPRTIADYLMWKYVDHYSAHIRDSSSKQSAEEPRWKYCLSIFDDVSIYATGNTYARYYEAIEKRSSVDEIFKDLTISHEHILKEITWMDAVTLQYMREKAAAIQRRYPVDESNNTILNTFYLEFEPSTIHLQNIRAIAISMTKLKYRFEKAPFKYSWSILDFVNAFYYYANNSIEIEDGFLQPPFFSADNIRAMNYGSLGGLIGHELTHAFDVEGVQFDKNGDPVVWPAASSLMAYRQRTDCIERQYSEYCWKGTSHCVNGSSTLSENIADNGGMQLAIEAYKEWIARNGKDDSLPDLLQFTPQQLFFISFAQSWCHRYTTHFTSDWLNNPHSPAQFRVLGVASNSKEFAAAFNCTDGARMNPASKCKFW